MQPVDYDVVAPAYDRRYSYRQYASTRELLRRFIGDDDAITAVEVGCGTGHWLTELATPTQTLIGIDLSWGMLRRARESLPSALLARADAVHLPVAAASVDRILCVNVLHHIRDTLTFLRECRRALKAGGAFVTIGLDPHTGTDRWWVYDYFPSALAADGHRYLATAYLRELLERAGFSDAATEMAEHLTGAVPFADASARGSIDRRATSQLMVITDAEFDAGLARLRADAPVLTTDLQLWATSAHAG